ncbi:hypothetical protein [Geodermatophilus sp. SYSU D01105]
MSVMLVRANERQEELVTALREQARVDALTGLVNRRVFDEALAETVTGRTPAGTALLLMTWTPSRPSTTPTATRG